jgi:hypothetical protein
MLISLSCYEINYLCSAAEKSSLLLQQIYRIESLLQESLAIDPEADVAEDSLFFDQDRDAIELVLEDRAKAAKKTQERLERGLQESHGAHVELYHIVEDIIDQHDHISIEIDRVVKDSLMLSEGIMHRNEETMKNNKRREQDLVSNVAAIEREAIERHERTRSSRMQSKITQTSKFQDRSNKPPGTAATTENSPGMDDKGTNTDPMMWTGSNAGVMHNSGHVSTHSPTASSSKQAQQQGRSTANALSNSAAMSPNNSSSAASSSGAMNSSSKQNASGSPHGQKEDNRMDRSNAQPQTTNYRSAGANRGAVSNNPREKSPIGDGTKRDDRSRVTPMATSKTVLLSPPNPLSPPVAAFNEQHARYVSPAINMFVDPSIHQSSRISFSHKNSSVMATKCTALSIAIGKAWMAASKTIYDHQAFRRICWRDTHRVSLTKGTTVCTCRHTLKRVTILLRTPRTLARPRNKKKCCPLFQAKAHKGLSVRSVDNGSIRCDHRRRHKVTQQSHIMTIVLPTMKKIRKPY